MLGVKNAMVVTPVESIRNPVTVVFLEDHYFESSDVPKIVSFT